MFLIIDFCNVSVPIISGENMMSLNILNLYYFVNPGTFPFAIAYESFIWYVVLTYLIYLSVSQVVSSGYLHVPQTYLSVLFVNINLNHIYYKYFLSKQVFFKLFHILSVVLFLNSKLFKHNF